MEIAKMRSVVEMYRAQLEAEKIPQQRIDPRRAFCHCTKDEKLAHAHYLVDSLKKFIDDPEKYGKANRHLAAIQMLLSEAGWYTLEDLMNHNRPRPGE